MTPGPNQPDQAVQEYKDLLRQILALTSPSSTSSSTDSDLDQKGLSQIAIAYIIAGLTLTHRESCYVQIEYIRSNMGTWRGPVARHYKHLLREAHHKLGLKQS